MTSSASSAPTARASRRSCGYSRGSTYPIAEHDADGAQLRMVFVVTDEDRLFVSVSRELPAHIVAFRLYESYLRNFEVEAGRSSR